MEVCDGDRITGDKMGRVSASVSVCMCVCMLRAVVAPFVHFMAASRQCVTQETDNCSVLDSAGWFLSQMSSVHTANHSMCFPSLLSLGQLSCVCQLCPTRRLQRDKQTM